MSALAFRAPAQQRVGPLSRLPELLQQFGVAPADALLRAGLSATALDEPDEHRSFAKLSQILAVSAQLTGCAHFALLAGRMATLGDLGDVGELVLTSETVGQALRRLAVYQQLNSEGALVYLMERSPTVELGYAIYEPSTRDHEFVYDYVSAQIVTAMRELCGANWNPSEVTLLRRPPSDAGHHRRFFRCRVSFGAENCAIRFPLAVMKAPLSSSDVMQSRRAEARLSALTKSDFLARTRRATRAMLLYGKCSGDELAATLLLHRRTLNRRLRDEGLTFRMLLHEVQLDLARQLLLNTCMRLDDIADSIGYQSLGAFMRSFKRWTGMSPRAWVADQRNGRRSLNQRTEDVDVG